MLQALRLINPGRRRAKAKRRSSSRTGTRTRTWPRYASTNPRKQAANPKPRRKPLREGKLRRVKTPSGTRFMIGGRFVDVLTYLEEKARRTRYGNPQRKAKKTKKTKRRAAPKRRAVGKRRVKHTTTKRRTTVATRKRTTKKRKSPKRVAAGKKAARTRKRHAAAKRATPKRRRRKTTTVRRRRRTTAAPKTVRRRRRRHVKTAAPKRRRRRNPRTSHAIGPKRRMRKAPKGYKLYARRFKSTKGKRGKGKTFSRYYVSANPSMSSVKSAMKEGLMLYAGLAGMRVVNKMLNTYVVSKFAASVPAKLLPILPAGLGFAGAIFFAPKLVKKANLLSKLQLGATLALIDAAVESFIKPMLPANVQQYLGYGAMSVHVPLAEYTPYDNRLGMGSGMGDYVDDNRYGADSYEVHEALAGDELAYMERGGAGGVFSKTVFSGVG